jgi:putative glutamine amidotransferase
MRIGITKADINNQNYSKWIAQTNPEIEIVELAFENSNLNDAQTCQGIILSGGIDMHPSFFLKEYSESYFDAPPEFMKTRDQFELDVLAICMENKIPVLGICRGLQLINVFFKGTLVIDIGQEKNINHRRENGQDKSHALTILPDSIVHSIINQSVGTSNSAHHQVIDKLGENLKAVAFSDDGLIEAIEPSTPQSHFLVAVQWHPERMPDQDNPTTKNIKEAFINASKQFEHAVNH